MRKEIGRKQVRKGEYNNLTKTILAAVYAGIIKITRYFLYIYILITGTKWTLNYIKIELSYYRIKFGPPDPFNRN